MSKTFHERLLNAIARAGSPVCVGLDPVPEMIPTHLGDGSRACAEFLSRIIDSTRDLVAAYKPNTAFFEAYGANGWAILESLHSIVGKEALLIVDAKRGDIEHTNEAYARAIFGRMEANAVTVQPYLGGAALEPFLRDPQKGAFVLCATSNAGAEEVQALEVNGTPLYLKISELAKRWNKNRNVGLVVGTTKPSALQKVLEIAPELPLLLPGGGAQGGTLEVVKLLRESKAVGLFNYSRSVIYASKGEDFAQAARREVEAIRMLLERS